MRNRTRGAAAAVFVMVASAGTACASGGGMPPDPATTSLDATDDRTQDAVAMLGPSSDTGVHMARDAVGSWCGGPDDLETRWTFHLNGYFTTTTWRADAEGLAWVSGDGRVVHRVQVEDGELVDMPDMAVSLDTESLSDAGVDIGVGNGSVLFLDGSSYVSC